MDDPRAQLEEMAQARERGQQQLAEALRKRDELEGPYHAACARVSNLTRAIKTITRGMETTRKAYAIRSKLGEMSIDYAQPIVYMVETFGGSPPEPWILCAVASDGTGLYLYTPKHSHRYHGKAYAILGTEKSEDEGKGHRQDAGRTSERMLAAGLIAYDKRARGPFGAGTGSIVPLPPPDGGKWRWIRVDEQALLAVGAA